MYVRDFSELVWQDEAATLLGAMFDDIFDGEALSPPAALSSNHVVPPGFPAFAPPPGLSCNHHVCNTRTTQHTQNIHNTCHNLPDSTPPNTSYTTYNFVEHITHLQAQHEYRIQQLQAQHIAQLQAQQAHHTHQLQQQHAAHLQAMQLLIQQVLAEFWEWLLAAMGVGYSSRVKKISPRADAVKPAWMLFTIRYIP